MSISLKKVNKNKGYAIDQGFPNFFMNVPLKQFQKLTVPLPHKN